MLSLFLSTNKTLLSKKYFFVKYTKRGMIDFIFQISFFKYLLSIPVSVYGVSCLIVKLKPKNSTLTAQKRSVIAKWVFCGLVFYFKLFTLL